MWKATIGVKPPVPTKPSDDDDWDTDPNYKNDISEKEARWGSKVIQGSGHQDALNMAELRAQVMKNDEVAREKRLAQMPKPSQGYGGKFGVETDRVDKSAVDWSYREKTEAHVSQKDYSHGFGGKYGVQTDRVDKSAVGWEERTQLEQHQSQKDYKQGFGGKFGIDERKDKSAVGWDDKEKVQPHESQTDYKKGFGGKYGVQTDRVDKSAVGWEERTQLQQHESQTDYKNGFGGKYGVQNDKKDKSAVGWDEREVKEEKKAPATVPKVKTADLRSRFEQMANQQSEDKVKEERERRKREDEMLKKQQEAAEQKRQQNLAEQDAQREPAKPVENNSLPSKVTDSTIKVDELQYKPPPAKVAQPVSAPAPAVELEDPVVNPVVEPKQQFEDKTLSQTVDEQIPAEPEPPMHEVRRESVASKADDEWVDDDTPTVRVLPAAEIPAEPTDSNAGSQSYDYVPCEPSQPSSNYDYVPEEPPAVHYEAAPAEVRQEVSQSVASAQESQSSYEEPPRQEERKLLAVALYEYEKQDDDEIGFEINDIITDIEQIDAGWWRGMCRGRYGLFPANYVQLQL
ncbi:unnamed protein product [Bursaphelenchus okinawaensis]|uniref:SH3 domain-containing protein n=1 Tax=Bursaphelenchus okinawaensis TaxID=465554 RepID=A0A811K4Q6_9BILA|nr:unnamed protein product [Bursaphelenchus okinawaensis]CAG9092433.1 unnamed protein product [Bursaphelenchus okinawaensis]